MRRVLVIGSPGSGKSTFAAQLATRTGLPLVHLDQHYWRAGWVEPDEENWRQRVAELIAADAWVMDGNYGSTLPLRLDRADTVIDLELPPWLCVTRVVWRAITQFGRTRTDMAEGCPERLDPGFFAYTARFAASHRSGRQALREAFAGQWITLRSTTEIRRFLASMPQRG